MPFVRARPPAEETRRIRLREREVAYRLRRSPRRRTVALRIDGAGLTVNAPVSVSRAWLERMLQDKAGWVLQKLDAWPAVPAMAWRDGAPLPFLGRQLTLRLAPGGERGAARLAGDCLLLAAAEGTARVEAGVRAWYRGQALAHFGARVALYARRLGVVPADLALSSARSRWGSCGADGRIRLNWRLIKAPPEQIDYVVAHELAHLLELNHSPAFWAIVARIFPDYAAVRRELRRCGPFYAAF